MSAPLLEEGIYQLLTQSAALTAFVPVTHIFLNAVPEGAGDPALCFSKVSAQPDATADGPSGLNIRRYQFDFFSSTMPSALRAQKLVELVLNGYSGTLPNNQRVFSIVKDNELDGFDDVVGRHRTITDYIVQFSEW